MMSRSLGTVEATLPPGFRFHPRDDELICDYLMKKIIDASNKYFSSSSSSSSSSSLLIEVDLNKCEPWDIPDIACVGGKEFYFYSQRDRKYATGLRTNRATVSGYWKATGKDRPVVRKGRLVGMRKTLVFYQGRAPKGRKSNWVMHEFRLEAPNISPPKLSTSKDDWVLCRMFHKSRSELSTKPDCGGSSSTLPPLMDSYVTVDQLTPYHNITDDDVVCRRHLDVDVDEEDDYDEAPVEDSCQDDNLNNNNIINNNNNNNEQVPCFSIFSPNETKYPTVLFSVDPSNSNDITNNTSVKNCSVFGPTATPTQDGPVLLSSNPNNNNNIIINNNNDYSTGRGGGGGGDQLSECDKHVIKAVLSQLTTRMDDRTEENNIISDHDHQINMMMKVAAGLSPVRLGSDHSYLSDAGWFPTPANTMWTNHY